MATLPSFKEAYAAKILAQHAPIIPYIRIPTTAAVNKMKRNVFFDRSVKRIISSAMS